MRPVAEHRADALSLVAPLRPVEVPLGAALALVLAEQVSAAADLPRWDNSAMDGYAVRAADTAGASPDRPVALRVVADLPAGSPDRPQVARGTAARIMTGAPVPPGVDAVVPVEDTDRGTDVVRVHLPARVGAHVRRAGEDVRRGDLVLGTGAELTPPALAALAATGRGSVLAHPAPRVGVVATGAELVPPGTEPGAGQVPDSNSLLVAAAVRACGGQVAAVRTVTDDVAALAAVFDELDGSVDLVVTTGGVSVGAYDVVRELLAGRGVGFVRVRMQPGKPQGLGRLDRGTPVLCLPGNPVSAFVSFQVFVRPVLARLRGADPERLAVEQAVLDDGWVPSPGRDQYMPVALSGPPGARTARRASGGGSGSHLVASLARADGLLVVPAGTDQVRPGDRWPVMITS